MMKIASIFAVAFVATTTCFGAESPVNRTFEGYASLESNNRIDELVFARLESEGIQPANVCSDSVFVRRVYLDVIGTLPTADEARDYLMDQNPDKRRILIDRLLERDEFADYWGWKWSDLLRVKAEFPINLWPNAAQAYHRWIRTSIKQKRPYDQFVREMLTANGSNFRVAPVNFYRAVQNKTPKGIAQTVALTFMGTRAENWPEERLAGMQAFFSQISFRSTGEWKEEIVSFDPSITTQAESDVAPLVAVFPDGTSAQLTAGQDPRVAFADWLIDPKNPWFTRNIVNRIWSWLLGRGIIHEPDDIRPGNTPSNPELLAFLERELVGAKYDLKHIYRLILNSKTYQLSSVSTSDRPETAANFASYPVRRLEAEVLIDALNQITGTTERYSSAIPEPFTYLPDDQRAVALPDGSITTPFLDMFGRSPRDTGLDSERSNELTAEQRLHMLNSSHVRRKIEDSPKLQVLFQSVGSAGSAKTNKFRWSAKSRRGQTANRLSKSRNAAGDQDPAEVAAELYLTILSRFPTRDDTKAVMEYVESATSRRDGMVDLAWALVNSAEFFYRH